MCVCSLYVCVCVCVCMYVSVCMCVCGMCSCFLPACTGEGWYVCGICVCVSWCHAMHFYCARCQWLIDVVAQMERRGTAFPEAARSIQRLFFCITTSSLVSSMIICVCCAKNIISGAHYKLNPSLLAGPTHHCVHCVLALNWE